MIYSSISHQHMFQTNIAKRQNFENRKSGSLTKQVKVSLFVSAMTACQGHAKHMPVLCLTYAWLILRTCQAYTWHMPGICLAHAWHAPIEAWDPKKCIKKEANLSTPPPPIFFVCLSIWQLSGFWQDRSERKHILHRSGPRVPYVLSHQIAKSVHFHVFR